MTRDLAAGFRVIVHAPEVVAAGHWGERAVERQNFETMPRQIEFANDLRAQQRDNVGANGKLKTGKDFFGNRRAAEHVAPLKHEHTLARAREIRRIYQTVVAAADDDDVVFVAHQTTTTIRTRLLKYSSGEEHTAFDCFESPNADR